MMIDERAELALMLQDVLSLSGRLASELDVYQQLVTSQPSLKAQADEYFASPTYDAKLQKYTEMCNKVLELFRKSDHVEFANELGALAGRLSLVQRKTDRS
jgi:hypothetical protein